VLTDENDRLLLLRILSKVEPYADAVRLIQDLEQCPFAVETPLRLGGPRRRTKRLAALVASYHGTGFLQGDPFTFCSFECHGALLKK
jgi:hypothetical protein